MTNSTKRGVPRRRREGGASIVELALIAPVMVLLVLGVLDLGRAYQLHIQLENAASEGAGHAQLYPHDVECPAKRDIVDRVVAEQAGVSGRPGFGVRVRGQNSSGAYVDLTGCGGTTVRGGARVRVDVWADYQIVTPLVANVVGDQVRLTGSSEVRVQGVTR